MALTTYYFLFFCMICQISNVAHSDNNEGLLDVITEVGIGNSTNFTTSNYQNNVNSLLLALTTESSRGFFSTYSGEGAGRAYGWYLCRGDLSAEKCNDCLHKVRQYMLDRNRIFYYYNGVVYNTQLKCVVHYSNSSTSFVYRENSTFTGGSSGDDLADHPQYSTILFSSLQELSREVGYGNSTKPNFETRVVYIGGTQEKISMLVQCTPDISAMNCSNCIRNLYSAFRPTKVGGDALGLNCLLKYDNQNFIGSGYPSFMPTYFHVILVLLGTMYLTFM